jgi:hypothetical protein
MTSTHDLSASTRRGCPIDSADGAGGVLASMIRDVKANHGTSPTRGISFDKKYFSDLAVLTKVLVRTQSGNELLFGETRPDAHNVHNVPLDDTDIRQVLTAKGFELFPFAIPLRLLLSKALMVLCRNGLELDGVIGVDTTAGGTTLVEILFDMVPAEPTDLISTDARLEVEIGNVHLLETQRTFRVLSFIVAPVRVLDTGEDVGL